MNWEFTLIESDLTETVIDEPVGWDALSTVLQRDHDWHGMSPVYSQNNLFFHDEAYFIIKEEYERKGVDGDIKLRIRWQCEDCSGESIVTIPPINIIPGLHGNLRFSPNNYSNSSFRAALASIPISVMRFPGGENASTYDWELGRDDTDTGQYNTLEQLKQLVDEAYCKVSFVLNICTKTLENQIAMLQHARDIGLLVQLVELGNEVNNTGSLGHSVYPTADAYADEMEIWMAAIRAEFPGVKVFLCGENKVWEPLWNDKMIAKNPDGLIWHEGVVAADYINEAGVVDRNALKAIIRADWITAGFDLVNIAVQCTEFNYKFDEDDPPLTDQQIYDTAYYMLQEVSALIGTTGSRLDPHLMCLRGAAGNQPAVDEVTFELTPIGLALRQFQEDSSSMPSGETSAVENGCMKTYLEGKLDFRRYAENCGEDCNISLGIEDTSLMTMLKDRQDIDVDLTNPKAYDGTTDLAAYDKLNIDITLPSKAIMIKTQAENDAPLVGNDFVLDSQWFNNTAGSPQNMRANVIAGYTKIIYTDILNSFVLDTPAIINGGFNGVPAEGLTPLIDLQTLSQNLSCDAEDAVIAYRYKGSVVATYHGAGGYFDIPEYQLIKLPAGLDPTVSANYQLLQANSFPLSGAFDISASVAVTMAPGDKFWLVLFLFLNEATDWDSYIITEDAECTLNISLTSICDPSPSKTNLIHEAASRVIESITNNGLKFKSEYFGRTDSQPYAFDADGCGGLRSISNGLNIRRAILTDSSEPKVFTNWKDILQSLNACDNIGFDVKDGNVRAEGIKFFYEDDVVFVCDGINSLTRKVKTDRIWNMFSFGFEKFETESTNGLDAQHTKRQYRIPIVNTDAALERFCKYILDGYAIEVTRRKFGLTEDWRYDQDMFMFCLKRAEATFEVEQGNITSPANMFDPDTVINYRLTPIRMLLRWFKWVMQGIRTIDPAASQMLFNSGEGNYVAKGLLDSLMCVLEAAAIAENDPLYENLFEDITDGKPFIVPEEVQFTFPLGLNEFLYLKEHAYGKIQYRRFPWEDWKFGWIQKLEPHHEDGDAAFTLVTALEGTPISADELNILTETGDVITTEAGQGLIQE